MALATGAHPINYKPLCSLIFWLYMLYVASNKRYKRMCIRIHFWFSRNRLNARLSESKESRRTRKEKRRTRTDKRSHFHLVMAQGFNKAPYSITQNFRGFQGKDGIQWNNDKNQHSVANIRFIADFVCPKTRLKRMPYGSCHFSNLRE